MYEKEEAKEVFKDHEAFCRIALLLWENVLMLRLLGVSYTFCLDLRYYYYIG